jgi:hypothetical protein
MPTVDVTQGRQLAQAIVAMPREQAVEVVRDLTRTKRLSVAMRTLNGLLQDPDHGELAKRALEHMGFGRV